MRLTIANQIRITDPDPELRTYLRDLLTLPNPKWEEAKKFGRWTGGIPEKLVQFEESGQQITVPRGVLNHLLEDLNRDFELEDLRVEPVAPPWPEPQARMRDDQETALRELLSHTHGFLSAPAGTGKTVLALEACRRLERKALWLTNRKELKDQVIEEAVELFSLAPSEIGVLHGQTWRLGDRLTVGMIPTLKKRDTSELEKAFGIIIVDEAHHVPANSFLEILRPLHSRYIYGLTATAYRNDGLESLMFNAVGPIRARIEHEELFEDEHLIKPVIVRRQTGWMPPKADLMDYHELMEAMVTAGQRNQLIVRDVVRECQPGNTAIVLVDRTKHAEILTDLLKRAGVKCEFVVGSVDVGPRKKGRRAKKKALPKKLREHILAEFKNGNLQVLVTTYDLLAEGFNYKPLNRLFLATPVKFKGTVTQAIGRVQRSCEGKSEARVYDYVDGMIAMFDRQSRLRLSQVYRAMEMPVQD